MFRDRVIQYLRCKLIITFSLIHMFINLTHRFNAMPVKIPETYFMDTDNYFSSLYEEEKGSEQPTQYGRRTTTLEDWHDPCQVPLSTAFSRQEYWSGWPCPSPGDLPDLGIEPASACDSCIAVGFFTHWANWEAHTRVCIQTNISIQTDANTSLIALF